MEIKHGKTKIQKLTKYAMKITRPVLSSFSYFKQFLDQ